MMIYDKRTCPVGAYCIAWYGRVLHYTSVVFSYIQINWQIKTRTLRFRIRVAERERVLKDIKRFIYFFVSVMIS
jgi:hypothetical protein